MAVKFKHKMIHDVEYTMIGKTGNSFQLRESSTGREFWITKAEFEKNYEKK